MDNQLDYFVEARKPYTADRPECLWRRLGDHWEYLSLIDWRWHRTDRTKYINAPQSAVLHPVTAERAAELAADHQVWVRYWKYYSSFYRWQDGDEPSSVVRRRNSPEWQLDEAFRNDKRWHEDSSFDEFWDYRTSSPPHLIEISVEEADLFIRGKHGVARATDL
ncbi:hypothetical protein OG203_26945 [Nocardia sp. NBC_01499]|uniref:hypothetical protein n=1 Tax=Nocardia sp. NBC_01499 TaxID=2903597 RepID=UPI003862F70E